MTPRRGQGGGQGRSTGGERGETLTRQQVVDAALEMVETGGVAALTVRGLAAKLSVAVTSIYWHVGDKDALFDAVTERVISQFGHLVVRGGSPEARLCSAARSLRRALLERADLVALVHRQGRTAELMQPARRVIVRELDRAGVSADRVPLAVQSVVNHVVGSVLLDRQVQRQPAQHEHAEDLWRADDVAQLSESTRLLAALSRPLDDDRMFEYALAVLVRAVIEGRSGDTDDVGS
jgi:AcrR family transcriptional regulator